VADSLTPDEIEALLSALSAEETETASQTSSAQSLSSETKTRGHREAAAYEVYDFRRQDKLSKDQLRTLQMLHETFARLASSSFAAFLRTPIHVELISVEQVPYEEYLRSINQSVFTILNLAPLSGQAVLEIEFALVFSIIDRMLGGPGKALERTLLTDIERPLATQIIQRALQTLKAAWEGVVIVNPAIEGIETSAQFVQIAPPGDICVMVLFEVKVGEQRGAMSLCIPYMVLKPVTTKLATQKWAASAGRKRGESFRRQFAMQISRTSLPCKVDLGKATVPIADFLALQTGDVLELQQRTDDGMVFSVLKSPKFLGHPTKVGKNMAFQITERVTE